MNDEKTACHLVIPGCPIKMRNLFVAVCEEYLNIDRAEAFQAMFKPFLEMVVADLSSNPTANDDAIDALKYEIETMFTPHHKGGGVIGF